MVQFYLGTWMKVVCSGISKWERRSTSCIAFSGGEIFEIYVGQGQARKIDFNHDPVISFPRTTSQ